MVVEVGFTHCDTEEDQKKLDILFREPDVEIFEDGVYEAYYYPKDQAQAGD